VLEGETIVDNEHRDPKRLREVLEAALKPSLGAGAREGRRPRNDAGATGSPVIMGEVLDTHHPHLPGRILVRWWETAELERSEWLLHERHLSLYRGDRVLVTLPLGGSEWIVTGALGRSETASSSVREANVVSDTDSNPAKQALAEALQPPDPPTLRLEPGQGLLVIAHDSAPLLALRQGADGLVIELKRDDVEIKVRRRLRLSANTIELAAGSGGLDVRTEGDAVTRARAIRLN
jgi:hypothetical protein